MTAGQARSRGWPGLMRVGPVRWLSAELVPLGFLALGLGLPWAWRPVGWFAVIGLIGGPSLGFVYLFKMHGASIGWLAPLIIVYLGAYFVGALVLGLGTGLGNKPITVNAAWRVAAIILVVLLAAVVAAAVATGERWVRRNRIRIAPSEAASWLLPQGNRGIWAPRAWLPP